MQADATILEKWKLEYIFRLKFSGHFGICGFTFDYGNKTGTYSRPDDMTDAEYEQMLIESINSNVNIPEVEWEKQADIPPGCNWF